MLSPALTATSQATTPFTARTDASRGSGTYATSPSQARAAAADARAQQILAELVSVADLQSIVHYQTSGLLREPRATTNTIMTRISRRGGEGIKSRDIPSRGVPIRGDGHIVSPLILASRDLNHYAGNTRAVDPGTLAELCAMAFREYDTDCDGKVAVAVVPDLLKQLGLVMTAKEPDPATVKAWQRRIALKAQGHITLLQLVEAVEYTFGDRISAQPRRIHTAPLAGFPGAPPSYDGSGGTAALQRSATPVTAPLPQALPLRQPNALDQQRMTVFQQALQGSPPEGLPGEFSSSESGDGSPRSADARWDDSGTRGDHGRSTASRPGAPDPATASPPPPPVRDNAGAQSRPSTGAAGGRTGGAAGGAAGVPGQSPPPAPPHQRSPHDRGRGMDARNQSDANGGARSGASSPSHTLRTTATARTFGGSTTGTLRLATAVPDFGTVRTVGAFDKLNEASQSLRRFSYVTAAESGFESPDVQLLAKADTETAVLLSEQLRRKSKAIRQWHQERQATAKLTTHDRLHRTPLQSTVLAAEVQPELHGSQAALRRSVRRHNRRTRQRKQRQRDVRLSSAIVSTHLSYISRQVKRSDHKFGQEAGRMETATYVAQLRATNMQQQAKLQAKRNLDRERKRLGMAQQWQENQERLQETKSRVNAERDRRSATRSVLVRRSPLSPSPFRGKRRQKGDRAKFPQPSQFRVDHSRRRQRKRPPVPAAAVDLEVPDEPMSRTTRHSLRGWANTASGSLVSSPPSRASLGFTESDEFMAMMTDAVEREERASRKLARGWSRGGQRTPASTGSAGAGAAVGADGGDNANAAAGFGVTDASGVPLPEGRPLPTVAASRRRKGPPGYIHTAMSRTSSPGVSRPGSRRDVLRGLGESASLPNLGSRPGSRAAIIPPQTPSPTVHRITHPAASGVTAAGRGPTARLLLSQTMGASGSVTSPPTPGSGPMSPAVAGMFGFGSSRSLLVAPPSAGGVRAGPMPTAPGTPTVSAAAKVQAAKEAAEAAARSMPAVMGVRRIEARAVGQPHQPPPRRLTKDEVKAQRKRLRQQGFSGQVFHTSYGLSKHAHKGIHNASTHRASGASPVGGTQYFPGDSNGVYVFVNANDDPHDVERRPIGKFDWQHEVNSASAAMSPIPPDAGDGAGGRGLGPDDWGMDHDGAGDGTDAASDADSTRLRARASWREHLEGGTARRSYGRSREGANGGGLGGSDGSGSPLHVRPLSPSKLRAADAAAGVHPAIVGSLTNTPAPVSASVMHSRAVSAGSGHRSRPSSTGGSRPVNVRLPAGGSVTGEPDPQPRAGSGLPPPAATEPVPPRNLTSAGGNPLPWTPHALQDDSASVFNSPTARSASGRRAQASVPSADGSPGSRPLAAASVGDVSRARSSPVITKSDLV